MRARRLIKGRSAVFFTEYESGNVNGTELFTLDTGKDMTKPYCVYVRVDDVRLKMEVDTGAAVSVISERLYNRTFKKAKALQTV